MAITKTNFINYTRCKRYCALDNVKKERLDSDISFAEYKDEELNSKKQELLNGMYGIDEDGDELDLVDKENAQLERMLKYYTRVEMEAGKYIKKYFGGKTIYNEQTFNQEMFDFTNNGIKYLCYIDIFNESNGFNNIIEVKATTSNTYFKLESGYKNQDKYPIFAKVNDIYYFKDEIEGYNIDAEMPMKSYLAQKEKLLDRYGKGKYIYDIAVQRFIIGGELKETNNYDKIKDYRFYLAVLNHQYVFDGTYENGDMVYNQDENGNEIIVVFDVTKLVEEMQVMIENDAEYLEKNLLALDSSPCLLSKGCGPKMMRCKFFDPICGSHIPKKNSSLNYVNTPQGFKTDTGERLKGLELINEGYINMLDIPESWITSKNHHIQRDCLSFGTQYIDKEKIKAGINTLKYPIYHLDFETLPCPVPRFRGEWPYIQSPFEFSLHIERAPGVCDKDKDNYVFLCKDFEDNRLEMVQKLVEYIDADKGTLFAQNVSFEKGRIKELAGIFPEYKEPLMKMYDRGFDLIWLVNNNSKLYSELGFDEERCKTFNFYDKYLSGSFSIKKTLPVFSDLSYDKLVVKNGTEAIVAYLDYPNLNKEEFKLKYDALVTYCKQDTWAMVVILDALRQLVK